MVIHAGIVWTGLKVFRPTGPTILVEIGVLSDTSSVLFFFCSFTLSYMCNCLFFLLFSLLDVKFHLFHLLFSLLLLCLLAICIVSPACTALRYSREIRQLDSFR